MWDPFIKAYNHNEWNLQQEDHPLEKYVEAAVAHALSAAGIAIPTTPTRRVYWSHQKAMLGKDPLRLKEEHIAMQRMAAASHLAHLDHTSHLSIHPEYGPWFSLRCCIVFDSVEYVDEDNSGGGLVGEQQCPLSPVTMELVKIAAEEAFSTRENAVGQHPEMEDVRGAWKKWLAVREVAGGGEYTQYRYSDHQILYHYTGDRELLKVSSLK